MTFEATCPKLLRPIAAGTALLVAGVLHSPAYGVTAITTGRARFEVLTPSLVRMEYSPDRSFVDAPTAVVQKRDWITVPVRSTRRRGWLILTTPAMTLRYRLHSGPFTATNLLVTWQGRTAVAHEWHPGMPDPGNLGGLSYSLDHISDANIPKSGNDVGSPPEGVAQLGNATPGLLSRSGFAFLDDSATPVLNRARTWIEPRPQPPGQDWYLFVYDRDYSAVLKEYAELCGPIPMVPRYALGPSITDFNFEYFPGTSDARSLAVRGYDEIYLEKEVSRLLMDDIPLTGFVLDYAWHDYGWQGGYDWSGLISHPAQLIAWLHERGLRLTLNDHPGYANAENSILSYHDSHATEVLKALRWPVPARPSFDMNLDGVWKLAPDPHEVGRAQHWYAPHFDDRDWKSPRSDLSPLQPWQPWRQLTPHRSVRWYRAWLRLPAIGGPLYLYFPGDIETRSQLFVNGKQVSLTQMQWPGLNYADIAPEAKSEQRNLIALRIEAAYQDTGLLHSPVGLQNVTPPKPIVFNLADPVQSRIFMRDLHGPLMRQGVDAWWVDGGTGAAQMPGLNAQLWTNRVYYDYEERATGKRAFILSRYGGWGSERYPAFFTGDTFSDWKVLAYEIAFTARGGNVLMPYISNDIGGFIGGKIPFDLYARWIEFGAFSPILRMHSLHENPIEGNLRMPWNYGDQGVALMRKYFSLRTRLLPYIYTYAWRAHRDSMPILRPLYLQEPDLPEAYRHSHEYYFGSEILVAPVLDPSGDRTVYLPPGKWIGMFDGRPYTGGTTFTAHFATDQTPVFVREGAIIPEEPVDATRNDKSPSKLIVNVYGSGNCRFQLYDDDGTSLLYRNGQYALTPMMYTTSGIRHELVLGPTRGAYAGQPGMRSYLIRIHISHRPLSISVDGRKVPGWGWDPQRSVASLTLMRRNIRRRIAVSW